MKINWPRVKTEAIRWALMPYAIVMLIVYAIASAFSKEDLPQ